MTIVSCTGLSKVYYEKTLFVDVSFGLQAGERVGIIGRNGAGKSSLLRILAGIDEPDEGVVAINRDIKAIYLEQQPLLEEQGTALEAVKSGRPDVVALFERFERERAAEADITETLTLLDAADAWNLEAKAHRYLGALGITDHQQRVSTMSGGQRKRTALARALFAEPDLIILDEPTNHLDADAVQWLQDTLMTWTGAVVFVTHDRYVLDAVSTRIVELDDHKLYSYDGGYEKYLERKEERMKVADATAEHQRNKLRRELAWLAKGAKARRTKQKSRIDWIAEMTAAPERTKTREIEITVGGRYLGGRIIDAVDVAFQRDGRTLFHNHTWRAKPLDRIGIIGPNGAGKTTLINVLSGKIQPTSGYVSIGETVTIGTLEQEPRDLREDATVLQNVRDVAEYIDTGVGREKYLSARELCERFLFTARQQHAYVHTLSGGERRRLSLLRSLMADPNVIVLDEPTNDFDIATLTALEDYLDYFKGVLLVVSHDRAFLDRVVTTIWAFEENGRIKEYPGNYSDYLVKHEELQSAKVSSEESARTLDTQSVPTTASTGANSRSSKKLSFKEQKEYEALVSRIAAVEAELADLEQRMSTGDGDYRLHEQWADQHKTLAEELDIAMARWMELEERQ